MRMISRRKYNMISGLMNELQCKTRLVSITDNEITKMLTCDDSEPIEFLIQWGTTGSDSREFAQQFIRNLNHAQKVADYLNSLELTVNYDIDDENVDELKQRWVRIAQVVETHDFDADEYIAMINSILGA